MYTLLNRCYMAYMVTYVRCQTKNLPTPTIPLAYRGLRFLDGNFQGFVRVSRTTIERSPDNLE